MKFKYLPFYFVLVFANLGFSGFVFGADEDEVEELVVTTRRISESLQEVPSAVSAFNTTSLERIQPLTIRDLDTLVPNLFIGMNTAGPNNGSIAIRGQYYGGAEKTQTSPVGVAIDGVFLGSLGFNEDEILFDEMEIAGHDNNYTERKFSGLINSIKISNEALYFDNYNANYSFTLDENTIGYWDFNEGQGNTLTDLSGNGNHGTIHGATWVERE